ncbi:MAG TPA: ATP-binding protein [Blastocatellia bacterium]|nr:ATP-binding protein [Blastocatellia bacterium]
MVKQASKEIIAYLNERMAQSPEDFDLRSLNGAETILNELASVFFPSNSAARQQAGDFKASADAVEEQIATPIRYQTLVEQIPVVIFMAYLDRGVGEAYVSPYIEALLGFSQEEWLSDPVRWYRQIHPEDKERWSLEAAQMFLTGEPLKSIYRVMARDGRVIWFHCEAKMVRRDDGRPWFIHGVAFDITELKEVEQSLREAHAELEIRVKQRTAELAKANEVLEQEIAERKRAEKERESLLLREHAARTEAEAANRAKDEFLATVSHELRTPLNAILGWARVARTGRLDEATIARALETIERNAKAQAQLVDDLLDVSRIISGKLTLNVRPIDLVSLIESALDSVRPAAAARGIQLQVDLDPRAGPVSGDPDRLQQVLWNLLSNAIKFTPGEGRVQVQLSRVDSQAEIRVSDTGKGISPDFLPYVFDRFRQADSTLTRRHGGLGLGLAIVRHLVELHGGNVHVHSDGEGKGAVFTVRLPLMIAHDAKRRFVQATGADQAYFECPPELKDVRVLVVDDEAGVLDLLAAVLSQCGSHVTTVRSAAEAINALQHAQADILVSDIQMPDEDGYSLIRRVRATDNERGRRLPAIALTAHASTEDRLRALVAGYDSHVAKPVEPAELIAVVASIAGRIARD